MTDIEAKALALWNEVRAERAYPYEHTSINRKDDMVEALCRAIEQHEAFRQEVSDIVYRALTSIAKGCAADAAGDLSRFIIPKPKRDPLAQVLWGFDGTLWTPEEYAKDIRAALDALGFEIREKGR